MKKPEITSILLTGASGFVGRRLAPRLAALSSSGASLYALGRSGAPDGWQEVHIDIAEEVPLLDFVERVRPDIVVHLAAQSSVGAKVPAEATWRTNLVGTVNLAVGVARYAPEATVLFSSSAEVYGDSFNEGFVDEDSTLRPKSVYAKSKVASEYALADILCPSNTLIVTRAFNHSGPGQDERFVLPSFAAQIARIEAGQQEPVIRVGNLDAERDFLHVDDVCEAYANLIAAAEQLPKRSAFNISSGKAIAIRGLLEELMTLSTAKFEVFHDPARMRPNDISRAAGSNARISEAIDWMPTITTRVLLEELLAIAREKCRAAAP